MSDIQRMLSDPELVWGTYPRDKPTREPDLEDEWRAELVGMSPSEFVEFMSWIWQGGDSERE